MYLRRPGSPSYEPFTLDVLRIDDGLVAEITTFGGDVFEWFGLPPRLTAE
jgi:RNA polymerase sigma-70 factor (ECF subfamily)